jgi:HTH-type transcriptional regulator/antitoxin HipB
LTNVNTTAPTMKKPATPATIGALARDARLAAGLSQSELAQRIGASRFWVAQFENGKPGAELGLALKALDALGLAVHVEPREAARKRERTTANRSRQAPVLPAVDLAQIIAKSTSAKAPSSRIGWPAASTSRRPSRRS